MEIALLVRQHIVQRVAMYTLSVFEKIHDIERHCLVGVSVVVACEYGGAT